MNPICCKDGDTETEYNNPCLAECAGFDNALQNDKCVLGKLLYM